jgi:flagellar assembly factor FliW
MILSTAYFGELEVQEEQVIYFSHGVFAFEDQKRFVLVPCEDTDIPMAWLQSLDDPDLAFVVKNPFVFRPDYEFKISGEVETELDIRNPSDVTVLVLLVIPDDVNKMTANLLAPVVINVVSKKGRQVILEDRQYHTKHLLSDELARLYEQQGVK